MLEIGVQNGGSLEVWSKFLPHGSAIIGIDIDPAVGELSFSGNVRAFVADINDMAKVEANIGTEPFDIIIDDGSHTSPDIISAFKHLFSKLAPGGKYFAKDLHCSYWKSHREVFGFDHPPSSTLRMSSMRSTPIISNQTVACPLNPKSR